MQPHGHALTPIPDVVRAPSAPPLLLTRAPLPRPTPEFLVIGLFALRLTKRLTESLEYYPGRDVDIIWLVNFLAPFNNEYALAKISGSRKDDYLATYQGIVSRMKKQPKYPARFMQMNPDQSMQLARRGGETARPKALTDAERLEIIDFCDAAGEWGSIVPIPAHEAERMIELADQRRIADLENPQPRLEVMQTLRDEMHPRLGETLLPREERRPLQEYRQPQHDDRIPVHNDSRPQHDNVHPLNDERRSFHQNRHPTQSGGQAWRGDEYMPPEHQQEREGQRLLQEDRTPQPEVRRTRRVSFADEREYFEDRRR